MARRRRDNATPIGAPSEAEQVSLRLRAARFAVAGVGGLPAGWVDDRWWSAWENEERALYRERGDDEAWLAHYEAGLKRLGSDAAAAYESNLRRLRREAEANQQQGGRKT